MTFVASPGTYPSGSTPSQPPSRRAVYGLCTDLIYHAARDSSASAVTLPPCHLGQTHVHGQISRIPGLQGSSRDASSRRCSDEKSKTLNKFASPSALPHKESTLSLLLRVTASLLAVALAVGPVSAATATAATTSKIVAQASQTGTVIGVSHRHAGHAAGRRHHHLDRSDQHLDDERRQRKLFVDAARGHLSVQRAEDWIRACLDGRFRGRRRNESPLNVSTLRRHAHVAA